MEIPMMKKNVTAALLSLLIAPVALAAGPGETFQAKCAACHGKDGKGQSDMAKKLGVKDLTVTKLPAAEIEKVIANGKGKMTPWKGKLSDAEISGLAKFVAGGLK
jgi:mono/diheme cytochrome c family protein